MSGEYLAQSKHQISANRLHKNVRLRIGFRRRTFLWQLDDIIKTAGCPRLFGYIRLFYIDKLVVKNILYYQSRGNWFDIALPEGG